MNKLFHLRFSQTYRKKEILQNFKAKAGVGNGIVAIKYYPIDMYHLRYGSDGAKELESRIQEGTLLNDIAFWHTEGLVESWSKDSTIIDREKKTITGGPNGTKVVSYDVLIEGGIPESPNLPPIHIMENDEGGKADDYVYRYKDSLLGVVPRTLHKNIFLLGFTRPTTGGLANMVEMQGLMVHKLLTQPKFMSEMRHTIDERIDNYNNYYYPEGQKDTPTDHLTFYGFYTHEVAKFMGIDRLQNLWDNVKSWNPRSLILNLRFELCTTNSAFKFRMDGEYCVEGANEMAWNMFEHFEHQAVVFYLNANIFWDLLSGCAFLYMAIIKQNAAIQKATCVLMLTGLDCFSSSLEHCNYDEPTVAATLISFTEMVFSMAFFFCGCYWWYSQAPIIANLTFSMPVPLFGLKAASQPFFMAYTVLYGKMHWLPLWSLGIAFISFLARQVHFPPLSGRYLFNDTRHKYRYREFYQQYKTLYQSVRRRQTQQGRCDGTVDE